MNIQEQEYCPVIKRWVNIVDGNMHFTKDNESTTLEDVIGGGSQGGDIPFIFFTIIEQLMSSLQYRSIDVAGLGSATIGKLLAEHRIHTRYIEISPVVAKLCQKYFNILPQETITIDDINNYIQNISPKTNTVLFLDAYIDSFKSTLSTVRLGLDKYPIVALNCTHSGISDNVIDKINTPYTLVGISDEYNDIDTGLVKVNNKTYSTGWNNEILLLFKEQRFIEKLNDIFQHKLYDIVNSSGWIKS